MSKFKYICRNLLVFLGIVVILNIFSSFSFAAEGDTIKQIKKLGELKIGIVEYPPFSMMDKKTNEWSGYDVEVTAEFAKFLKVKPKYVRTTWGNLIAGLLAKKYDITCNQYRTPERTLTINFTNPYFKVGQGFLIRKEDKDKFKTLGDFNKKDVTISVTMGSAGVHQLPKLVPKAKVKEVPGQPVMSKLEVQAKRADANWSDIVAILKYSSKNPWAYVLNPKEPFFKTPLAFGLRKGDFEFFHFLNVSIEYLKTQGTLEEFAEKYIYVLGTK